MIKHKNLTRDDDERLKQEGRGTKSKDEEKGKIDGEHDEKIANLERASSDHDETPELGPYHRHSDSAEGTDMAVSPGGSSTALYCQHPPEGEESKGS